MFSNEAFHIAKNLYAKARDSRRSKADVVVWLAEQIDALIAARSAPPAMEECNCAVDEWGHSPTCKFSTPASAPEEKECSHRNIVCLNGQEVCADCGVADPAPAPRCDGSGQIQEGTGYANGEGGEEWRVYDCPGCPACQGRK